MAIVKDVKRNQYYINYKIKDALGNNKNVNIKNKDWKITGIGKVGIRYMQSIEAEEIAKDKAKRAYIAHDSDTMPLQELCKNFYQVMLAGGMDSETVYNYEEAFKNYLFPIIPASTPSDKAFDMTRMDAFRINLTSKGLKEHTINNKMVAVKKLITYAKKRKYVSRDMADDAIDLLEPLREHSRESERDNFFVNGEEDLRKFEESFDKADKEWRVPILTLFYGAFRIGEWQAIDKRSVDFDEGSILVNKQIDNHGVLKHHTKTGEDRRVRLPQSFMQELKAYMDERCLNEDDFVFVGACGGHVSRHAVRNVVNRHLEMAGLNHITLHGLRHSFATRMFDKGYDVKEVQQHLGHASMETTMKYYIHYTQRKNAKNLDDLL